MEKDEHRYDYMLDMPYRKSLKRKNMSRTERAAQFGAFRALTGYEDEISETARLTDRRIELDEYHKSEIDRKLRYIFDNPKEEHNISVTYFVPDKRKSGGEYRTKNGTVKHINDYKRYILFADGDRIMIDSIVDMDWM